MLAARRRTTACLSMPSFIDTEPAFHGVICPRAMATGKRRTSACGDGAKVAFLRAFSRLWRLMPMRSTCRSIQPASAPTNIAQAPTPGQAADITQAAALLDQVEPEAFLADKGYDSDALIDTLRERGITPVIPSKANRREARKTDFVLYRERNLVERFFNKLKQYRALATRYDKLANTFLAAVALVCVLFWLN